MCVFARVCVCVCVHVYTYYELYNLAYDYGRHGYVSQCY